jgi:hypothetical protein
MASNSKLSHSVEEQTTETATLLVENTVSQLTLNETVPGLNIEELKWEVLGKKYQCGICLEVLCRPMTLECSHSFCYNCLDELLKNESYGRAARCPVCQEIYVGSAYNRICCDIIRGRVEKIRNDLPAKIEWMKGYDSFANKWRVKSTLWIYRPVEACLAMLGFKKKNNWAAILTATALLALLGFGVNAYKSSLYVEVLKGLFCTKGCVGDGLKHRKPN